MPNVASKDLNQRKMDDCAARFSAVFDGITPVRMKWVDDFFKRFLPKDFTLNWKGATQEDREINLELLRMVAGYLAKVFIEEFYEPYHKCNSDREFPNPCPYDVLVPYLQPETKCILYAVVPANTKVGDTVVFLFNVLSVPIETDTTEGWCAFIDSFLNQTEVKQPPVQQVDDHLKTRRKNKTPFLAYRGDAKIGSNIGILMDEPVLRLPCYNIALQIAYEMVSSKIINYTGLSPIAWSSLVAEKKHMPSDLETFLSLCLWSTWKRFGVKDHNKLRWLIEACDAEGFKCRYSTDQLITFRRQMNRKFETHLRTAGVK